jgi:hypothetical protein
MEEVLDDQPLFHTMVRACCDIFLEMFPGFQDGFILELLKIENPVPKGVGLAHLKVLGQECIRASIPCGECILVGVEPRLCFPSRENGNRRSRVFSSVVLLGLIVLLTSRKF